MSNELSEQLVLLLEHTGSPCCGGSPLTHPHTNTPHTHTHTHTHTHHTRAHTHTETEGKQSWRLPSHICVISGNVASLPDSESRFLVQTTTNTSTHRIPEITRPQFTIEPRSKSGILLRMGGTVDLSLRLLGIRTWRRLGCNIW